MHKLPGPKHSIVCEKVKKTLGVDLSRGHAGVRGYIEKLVSVIRKEERA
jgi:hypothetical protein